MFKLGDLVSDSTGESFTGPGKLVSLNEVKGTGSVGFFKSPLYPEDSKLEINLVKMTLLG